MIEGVPVSTIVGAVVGGVVAYVGGFLQQLRERRRRRRTVATVMMADLASLDVTLRGVYEHPMDGALSTSAFAGLDLTTLATELFQPETAVALLRVTSEFGMVRAMLPQLASTARPRPLTIAIFRMIVTGCVQAIPELRSSLQREGALPPAAVTRSIPDAPPEQWSHPPTPPPLPSSPFSGRP
jgi:hypothetical protein